MPKKWKVFKVIAIVQIVFSLLIIASLAYSMATNYHNLKTSNFLWNALFLILFTNLFAFPVLNIYIIQKNFPNTDLTSNNHSLFLFLFIFYCIAIFCITLVYFYGIYDTINRFSKGKEDDLSILMLAIFSILIFSGIYILINSLKLKRLIKLNAEEKQLAEIDNFFKKV